MRTAIRRASPTLTLLPLALILLALAASTAHAAGYTHESFSVFETQLKSGEIREATINKRVRSVRTILADGRHVLAKYAAKEEPKIARELKAHNVAVTILTPAQAKAEQSKAPIHHKIRYIVGGVVIGLVVIGGAVVLYRRRRTAQSY
jgi:hypothetical protein